MEQTLTLNFFSKVFLIFFASLGFSLLFDTKMKYLPTCAFFGSIIYCTMQICTQFFDRLFLSACISAAIAALLSELSAKILKAPSTVFLLPAIIPLVPGSKFFYAMRFTLTGDLEISKIFFLETIEYTLGISAGILIASFLFKIIYARILH